MRVPGVGFLILEYGSIFYAFFQKLGRHLANMREVGYNAGNEL